MSGSVNDDKLCGGAVEFGAIQLFLYLGTPDSAAIPRPSALVLRRQGSITEKVFAIAWPELGHGTVEYTRLS